HLALLAAPHRDTRPRRGAGVERAAQHRAPLRPRPRGAGAGGRGRAGAADIRPVVAEQGDAPRGRHRRPGSPYLPGGRSDLLPAGAARGGRRADPAAARRADRLPAGPAGAGGRGRAARIRDAALPRASRDPDSRAGGGRGRGGRARTAWAREGRCVTLTVQRAVVVVIALLATAWLLVSYSNSR